MKNTIRAAAMLSAGLSIGSCTDPVGPDSPVGSYTAITFVTTDASGTTNQLQVGSSLTINVARGGTTTGHLHVAASGGNPALDADMTGTWTQTDDNIDFSQAADTFVRDVQFRMEKISTSVWALVADQVIAGTRINLTLARGN